MEKMQLEMNDRFVYTGSVDQTVYDFSYTEMSFKNGDYISQVGYKVGGSDWVNNVPFFTFQYHANDDEDHTKDSVSVTNYNDFKNFIGETNCQEDGCFVIFENTQQEGGPQSSEGTIFEKNIVSQYMSDSDNFLDAILENNQGHSIAENITFDEVISEFIHVTHPVYLEMLSAESKYVSFFVNPATEQASPDDSIDGCYAIFAINELDSNYNTVDVQYCTSPENEVNRLKKIVLKPEERFFEQFEVYQAFTGQSIDEDTEFTMKSDGSSNEELSSTFYLADDNHISFKMIADSDHNMNINLL